MVLTTYSIMANLHWLRPELRKVEKGTIIRMKHLHHLEMCLETEDIVHTKPGLGPMRLKIREGEACMKQMTKALSWKSGHGK